MYGKLFESMYDGTLVDDWRALITFQQMIILSDADGTIDITPKALSRRTGIPIEHIEDGIKILESKDPYSRSPELEGRRIKLLDEDNRPWGWYIVNHEKYKFLINTEQRREKERARKRKQRDKQAENSRAGHAQSQHVPDGHAQSAMSRHEDESENELKDSSSSNEPDLFELFWKSYRRKEKKKDSKKIFNLLSKKNQILAIKDSSIRHENTDTKFIPIPTSYLNGERWKDELNESKDQCNDWVGAV